MAVEGGVLGDVCLEQFQSFFRAARAAAKLRKQQLRESEQSDDSQD